MFVVAGSTGNVGSALVRILASRGEPVRAVTRSPERARFPDGVEPVGADLDRPESLQSALRGATGVFLLSGYADMSGLLAEVRTAGVRRVVLLSSSSVSGGAGEHGDLDNAVAAYHLLSERAVVASGVAGTFLRPSMFMTGALQWREELADGDVIATPWPDVSAAVIDPSDIAAVAAVALADGGPEHRVLRLTGPEALLPADRVRILAEALGRPLTAQPLTDEEAVARLEASMPAEYVDAFRRFYVDGDLDESPVLPTVQEVLGRPPGTFTEWAAAHRGEF